MHKMNFYFAFLAVMVAMCAAAPQQSVKCRDNSGCPDNEACTDSICTTPCLYDCPADVACIVQNHRAECIFG
ncbi:hypothetical protein R5R35_007041 [Gryllus longicercus]|uniref:Accessory gland protein n=2 Tax=Gryllus longicercus TaxID=2509291 RepID=A0AAN9VXY3_9ORTH